MFNPADIQKGMTVRDRDGEKLGTIVKVDPRGFTIEKGVVFLREYPVGFSDVTDVDGDDVYLRRDVASLPDAALLESAGRSSSSSDVRRAGDTREVPLSHDLTGGLGLSPRDLEEARMDSAKFQDHGRYHVGAGEGSVSEDARARPRQARLGDTEPSVVAVRPPPVVVERRVSVREEEETVRRDASPDLDPSTRR
jgi:hypothetical protein